MRVRTKNRGPLLLFCSLCWRWTRSSATRTRRRARAAWRGGANAATAARATAASRASSTTCENAAPIATRSTPTAARATRERRCTPADRRRAASPPVAPASSSCARGMRHLTRAGATPDLRVVRHILPRVCTQARRPDTFLLFSRADCAIECAAAALDDHTPRASLGRLGEVRRGAVICDLSLCIGTCEQRRRGRCVLIVDWMRTRE